MWTLNWNISRRIPLCHVRIHRNSVRVTVGVKGLMRSSDQRIISMISWTYHHDSVYYRGPVPVTFHGECVTLCPLSRLPLSSVTLSIDECNTEVQYKQMGNFKKGPPIGKDVVSTKNSDFLGGKTSRKSEKHKVYWLLLSQISSDNFRKHVIL